MKRFLSILLVLTIFTGLVFAESDGDDYDDGYVYEINGAGDQFFKFGIGAFLPVNFGGPVKSNGSFANGSLYTGGDINLGYYKFINNMVAVGGEAYATYNLSIGNKLLVTIPLLAGVMVQPTLGKFEFPFFFNAGVGYETWQNMNYFPSLVASASSGIFYRVSEPFSIGATADILYTPQFSKGHKPEHGVFASFNVTGRYHF